MNILFKDLWTLNVFKEMNCENIFVNNFHSKEWMLPNCLSVCTSNWVEFNKSLIDCTSNGSATQSPAL